MNIVDEKIYIEPIKEAITIKLFNECFGEGYEIPKYGDKPAIAAKIALIGVYQALSRGFPEVCNMREIFMSDYSMTADQVIEFFNISKADDIKLEYLIDLRDNIKSLLDEYDFLKKKIKVTMNEASLEKCSKLIEKYIKIFKEKSSKTTEEVVEKKEVKKTSKKIGRPKLSDDMKRKNKVVLYFTDEEISIVKKLAKGKPLSVFVKSKLL